MTNQEMRQLMKQWREGQLTLPEIIDLQNVLLEKHQETFSRVVTACKRQFDQISYQIESGDHEEAQQAAQMFAEEIDRFSAQAAVNTVQMQAGWDLEEDTTEDE